MSISERLTGIFSNPQRVFSALAEKPIWVDALIVIFILIAAFSYFAAPYSQTDQIRLMKDNTKLKERLGDDQYNKLMDRLEKTPRSSIIIRSVVIGSFAVLLGFFFSSLILMVMGRFVSSQGSYIQVLAAVIHANFVDKLLGNAVRLILIASRKSVMQISTGPAFLFPHLDVTSSAYIILGQLDFFQLWMFGILAFGLASIFKIDIKKALIISYGFWFLKALFGIGLGIIGMKFLK